jgi:hypothetical protein
MAPGDPLVLYEGYPSYREVLVYYQAEGFQDLGDEILEIIRNTKLGDASKTIRAGEVRRLWSRQLKNGHVLRGVLGMVESRNENGKTAVFQFLYTSSNDGRYIVALTVGIFNKEEKSAFCQDHGGEPDHGGR